MIYQPSPFSQDIFLVATRFPFRFIISSPKLSFLAFIATTPTSHFTVVSRHHTRHVAGDERRLRDANFTAISMTPANSGPLLSSRPNPSLPPSRSHRRPHPSAAANTTGAASAPDWFRPRRTPKTDPSTSGGRVAVRDPGVRVNAKEGADGKKKEGRKRRWWERWSRDKESYLVDDVEPLPLPMTVPETHPMSREELDRRLSCDIEIEVSAASVEFTFFLLIEPIFGYDFSICVCTSLWIKGVQDCFVRVDG
jgi:hypothetical protein